MVPGVTLTPAKRGSVPQKPQPDINPAGPTTLTAIADTGSGSIMSTIFGQVTTKDRQCQFMPTIGSTVVPYLRAAWRVARRASVGHEQDRVAVVLQARMNAGEVGLRQLDQLVLVLARDG